MNCSTSHKSTRKGNCCNCLCKKIKYRSYPSKEGPRLKPDNESGDNHIQLNGCGLGLYRIEEYIFWMTWGYTMSHVFKIPFYELSHDTSLKNHYVKVTPTTTV